MGKGSEQTAGAARERGLRPVRRHLPGLPRDRPARAAPTATTPSRRRSATCSAGCTARPTTWASATRGAGAPPAPGSSREQAAGAAGAAPAGGRDRELRAGRRAARPPAGAGMIDLSLLTDGGVGWLDASGPASHLVLSTRIRLARNLAGHVFQGRNSETEREAILGAVERAARESVLLRRATRFRLDRLDRLDRQLLHERHLVSKELAGLDPDGRVRSGATLLVQEPDRGDGQRGGPPPDPGPPLGLRAGRGLRRGGPAGRRTGTTTCFRISPGVRLSYLLSDQRRDRAPRIGADPPARARAHQGNQQGPAGAGAGRTDASAACTARAARSSAISSSCRIRPRWAGPSGSCSITWARWSAR